MTAEPRASRFVRSRREGEPRRIRVSFEFFPPKTEEMEKTLWEFDHPACAASAELRLGHVWRGRIHA